MSANELYDPDDEAPAHVNPQCPGCGRFIPTDAVHFGSVADDDDPRWSKGDVFRVTDCPKCG